MHAIAPSRPRGHCHQPLVMSSGAGGLIASVPLAVLFLLALSLSTEAQLLDSDNDKAERTLKLLQNRKQQQVQLSRDLQAFHDFQFTDRIQGSGITFKHEMADDAGKNWKPAHYDHGNGIAAADVDGDGKTDLLFITQLGSNRLYRNLGGGRFEEITELAGVGMVDQISVAASFADIDNDGDPDLFITTVRHGNRLFENLGGGKFRDITESAGVAYSGHSSGAVFVDYDNDGLLDLFVCNIGKYTTGEKGARGFFLAYEDAFEGHMYPGRSESKILYRNLGGNRFKDVTAETGLRDGSWTGDGTFCDLNGDRFPDLYLVNMQGEDVYFENVEGKKFVRRTAELFPRTPFGAMGVKFFDYNNDGRMDLLVTDMHSDMTDRQRQLAMKLDLGIEKEKSDVYCGREFREVLLRNPTNYVFGNAFYENQGGSFVEKSDAMGLETYWAWGVSVADVNADGFEDVFITAGMGFPFRYGINSLLLNDAGKKFWDAEFLLGIEPRAGGKVEIDYFTLDCDGVDKGHRLCQGKSGKQTIRGATSTRSSVLVDIDGDGDLDLVTNEFNDRPQLLISDLSEKKSIHFLKVKLRGTRSNRDGLGATVKVSVGASTYTRYHDGKSGYLSQGLLPLYFGLGAAPKAERIEVLWPSGKKQLLTEGIPTNGEILLTEPSE